MEKSELIKAVKYNESFLLDKIYDIEVKKVKKINGKNMAIINVFNGDYELKDIAVSINRIYKKNKYLTLCSSPTSGHIPDLFKSTDAMFNFFMKKYKNKGVLTFNIEDGELIVQLDGKLYKGELARFIIGTKVFEEEQNEL